MSAFDYVIILTCNVTEPSENERDYTDIQFTSLSWSLYDLKANKVRMIFMKPIIINFARV